MNTESETKHTLTAGSNTFHKEQLAVVTKLVGQHPEILRDASGQANIKTQRDALRSKNTCQFHSPEKTVPDDVISHRVVMGPPGTKGSNYHRSQSWKDAKKAAEGKTAKKKATEVEKSKATNQGDSNQANLTNSAAKNPYASGIQLQAGPTLSVPNQVQQGCPKSP